MADRSLGIFSGHGRDSDGTHQREGGQRNGKSFLDLHSHNPFLNLYGSLAVLLGYTNGSNEMLQSS